VDLVLVISVSEKCAAVLLFTGVAAPIAGLLFRRVAGSWDSIGQGPFAIEQELPLVPRYLTQPGQSVDPAIRAAEVRQMLQAKSERQKRRGETPIDIDAETTRLLAPADDTSSTGGGQDAELRAEVRQLVVSRNERRMRKGLLPLDVEAETEHQLDDFIGSR
jgi:hypothetical protein